MIRVLYAHDVVSARTPARPCGPEATVQTEVERLERLIRNQNMFTGFLEAVESQGREQNGTLLTLDDGYRSALTTVKPLIERYGVVCMVFVTTAFVSGHAIPYEYQLARVINSVSTLSVPGWVDRGEDWPTWSESEKRLAYEALRRKLKSCGGIRRSRAMSAIAELNGCKAEVERSCDFLSWDEVRELAEHPLFRIGAHSCTHPALTTVARKEAKGEIVQSKSQLEAVIGRPVECFAYPYGSNSRLVRALVERSGFKCAFATGERSFASWSNVNRFAIPRVDIDVVEMWGA
jgi:peptidoglycan/xylan/chitin deacetylase (PgdA/CDA1 family)